MRFARSFKNKIVILLAVILFLAVLIILIISLFSDYILKKSQQINFEKGVKSYEEAITGLKGGEKISPEEREESYKKAIENLEKVTAVQSTNLEALLKTASSYYNLGNLDEAAETLRKAIEIDPLNASIYNNLGNILRDQNKLEEAKSYYYKAIELNPNLTISYLNLAVLLKALEGNTEEAIKVLEEGIDRNPEDGLLRQLLGEYKK